MNNAVKPQVVQFDSNDCSKLTCKECGHDGFDLELKVIESPYLYQAAFGNQKYMNIQYYKCTNPDCGCVQALNELVSVAPEKNKVANLT